jgi:hypothetical protein
LYHEIMNLRHQKYGIGAAAFYYVIAVDIEIDIKYILKLQESRRVNNICLYN